MVEASTLAFLTRAALEEKRKDKVENKAKEAEEAKDREEWKAKFEEKMLEVNRRSRRYGHACSGGSVAALDGHRARLLLVLLWEEEEEEEEKNQIPVWVPGQLLLMTPHRFSLHSGFRVRCLGVA